MAGPGGCGGDCLSASCGSWGSGGRYSCCRRGVHDRSPVCYAGACQVLFDLVWLLIPGSNWGMVRCDRSWSSVGGYRVSLFDCCWSGHYLCCGCDACWGWRFACCPAAVPGESSEQQRQVGSRSRGRRSRSSGEGADRRARERSRGGLLLLTALRVVGGGAIALPQIHLRMTELTLLLPDPGMRLEVRVLVALPGILTACLVLGRRSLLQGMSLAGLERVVDRLDLRVWRMMTAPLPSRGFAWREVAWVAFPLPMASSRLSGSSPVLLVSRFWARFFHPLLGAPLLGCLSVVPAAWLTAVSLACGLALAVFRAVAGCHAGIDGPFFLAFGRRERLLLIYPGLF